MQARRLDFLDGLRGCAALGVIIYHLSFITSPPVPVPDWLRPVVLFGGGGVALFFVVSAFSLCLTMPLHERTGTPLFSFYVKRLLRIAPLFYAVLAYDVACAYAAGAPWLTGGRVALDASFLFNLVPAAADSLVFAGWTIGVEMLFYLIFPFLFRWLSGWPRKLAAFVASLAAYPVFLGVLASARLDQAVRDRYSLLTLVLFLPCFTLGMLAFDLYAQLHRRERAHDIGAVLIALGGCLSVFLATNRLDTVILFHAQWQALCFGLLVLGVALTGLPAWLARPAGAVGIISYSTYLLHGPVIVAMHPLLARIATLHASPILCLVIATAVTLTVVLPASWLSYRIVELPGINLAKAVVRRHAARRSALLMAALPDPALPRAAGPGE